MNEATKTPLTDVRTVGVPVTDQDRAVALQWEGVPPMFALWDQDGNGLEIVEQAA